jgi:Icc protein
MTDRRQFLTSSSLFGLTVAVTRYSAGSQAQSSTKIALLSDTHIHTDPANAYRGFRPHANLEQAVKQVIAYQPSVAFVCGDAARADGQLGDYQQLKRMLTPMLDQMPVHLALGNHDNRDNFTKVFANPAHSAPLAGKKHVSVVDVGVQRWIVLDSLMYVDKVPGHLGQEQRSWLDKTLSEATAKPTVLMVHHTLGEKDGDLLDTERLFAIVDKHPQVKAILFGHSHQWRMEKHGKVHLINLPAVAYNFDDTQPIGWCEADLTATELNLTMRTLGGNEADNGKRFSFSFI